MEDRRIRVGITHGDTNGVGYELIFKTFAEPAMLELCTPIIYGSPKVATYHRNALDLQTSYAVIANAEDARDDRLNLLTTFEDDVKVDLGTGSEESSAAAVKALQRAVADAKQGLVDAIVTLPFNLSALSNDHIPSAGQTEYVEQLLDCEQQALTILTDDNLRIAFATTRRPIKDVTDSLTKDFVMDRLQQLHQSLRRDFRLSVPRIAVLSLNPKDTDGNFTGNEEKDFIYPAIIESAKNGIQAFGPYTADALFGSTDIEAFDAVLAMHLEQGLTPFKTLTAQDGICLTAGLPIVRTTPLMDNILSHAGEGTTDEAPLRHAVFAAIDIARHRANHDAPLQHPLPKLYHEKRDESEKVRFSIPKARAEKKNEHKFVADKAALEKSTAEKTE